MFRQLMIVFALAVSLLIAPVALADEPMSPREIVSDWFSQWLGWIGVDAGATSPEIAVEKSSQGGTQPSPPESSDPQDPDTEVSVTIDPNG